MVPVIARAQMSRQEWLEWLTKCCRFDPRMMFDAQGNRKRSPNSTTMNLRPLQG
jgi:hypothetical protein